MLRPEQVAQWHERGFLVVDGIWPSDLITAAAASATRMQTPDVPEGNDDPTVGACSHFPHGSSALNAVVLHPRVLAMVSQLVNGKAEFYVSASVVGGLCTCTASNQHQWCTERCAHIE